MNETPGANIEDASGEIRVMLASKPINSHFLDSAKFNGISGSSCDSQPTIPLSKSDSGNGAGSSRAFFLLLEVRFVAIRDSLLFELDFVGTRSMSFSFSGIDFPGPALIDSIDFRDS